MFKEVRTGNHTNSPNGGTRDPNGTPFCDCGPQFFCVQHQSVEMHKPCQHLARQITSVNASETTSYSDASVTRPNCDSHSRRSLISPNVSSDM